MRRLSLACLFLLISTSGLSQGVAARKPTISPAASEIVLQEGNELRLECQGEGNLHFVMMETMPKVNASNFEDEGPGKYVFRRPRARKEDTGWYACAEEGVEVENNQQTVDRESNDVAWIYVYVNSSVPFAVDTYVDHISAVAGETLVVPCRTTSPNLTPRLEINFCATEVPADTKYDPKIGFILNKVGMHLSQQTFECTVNDGSEAERASYSLRVMDREPLKPPTIKKDPYVFRGQDQTLVCEVHVPIGMQKCNMSWEVPSVVPTNNWNQSSEAICVRIPTGGQTCRTELTIKKFEASYDGSYGCRAEVGLEAVSRSVDIRSLAVPSVDID